MALMVVYYITITIKIRICTPIRGFWDMSTPATCIDVGKLFIPETSLSVFTGSLILLLPLPLIFNPHLPLLRKFKVFALLGAGALATGMTVVRLVVVLDSMGDPDETVSVVLVSFPGSAELAIGLICASLPALNAVVSRVISSRHSNAEAKSKDSNADMELGSSSNWRGRKGHMVVEWKCIENIEGDETKYDLKGYMKRVTTNDGVSDWTKNRNGTGGYGEVGVSYLSDLGNVRRENLERCLEFDCEFKERTGKKEKGVFVSQEDQMVVDSTKPAVAAIK